MGLLLLGSLVLLEELDVFFFEVEVFFEKLFFGGGDLDEEFFELVYGEVVVKTKSVCFG